MNRFAVERNHTSDISAPRKDRAIRTAPPIGRDSVLGAKEKRVFDLLTRSGGKAPLGEVEVVQIIQPAARNGNADRINRIWPRGSTGAARQPSVG
jgi:hypothetical protein